MKLNYQSSDQGDDNMSVKTKPSPAKIDNDRKSILSRNSRNQSQDKDNNNNNTA